MNSFRLIFFHSATVNCARQKRQWHCVSALLGYLQPTAATFLALHCIRGHLALWSDIYTKVSSQLPILMLTQYQYNSEGRSALRVGQWRFCHAQFIVAL